MRFLDEYRDPKLAQAIVADIRRRVTKHWVLMEICGGQTHTLMRYGIDNLLPPEVELVHGPGCPVCVTPLATIDRAQEIAALPGTILATYGDMLRVPGSHSDLFHVKAAGGDVRIVYSPLDAVALAVHVEVVVAVEDGRDAALHEVRGEREDRRLPEGGPDGPRDQRRAQARRRARCDRGRGEEGRSDLFDAVSGARLHGGDECDGAADRRQGGVLDADAEP